jgi:hypothetical protein
LATWRPGVEDFEVKKLNVEAQGRNIKMTGPSGFSKYNGLKGAVSP